MVALIKESKLIKLTFHHVSIRFIVYTKDVHNLNMLNKKNESPKSPTWLVYFPEKGIIDGYPPVGARGISFRLSLDTFDSLTTLYT